MAVKPVISKEKDPSQKFEVLLSGFELSKAQSGELDALLQKTVLNYLAGIEKPSSSTKLAAKSLNVSRYVAWKPIRNPEIFGIWLMKWRNGRLIIPQLPQAGNLSEPVSQISQLSLKIR